MLVREVAHHFRTVHSILGGDDGGSGLPKSISDVLRVCRCWLVRVAVVYHSPTGRFKSRQDTEYLRRTIGLIRARDSGDL
jgi:hypothetical protein